MGNMSNPTTVHYCYRQKIHFRDEPAPRYIIPFSDPMEYEHPFDALFDTPEGAIDHLTKCIEEEEYGGDLEAIRDDLVLVKITIEPVT